MDELTVLRLQTDGYYYFVDPACIHTLDAAVTEYVDSGRTRDRLLALQLLDGGELRVLASNVEEFWIATPATRRREAEINKILADEQKAFRQELGIFETPPHE